MVIDMLFIQIAIQQTRCGQYIRFSILTLLQTSLLGQLFYGIRHKNQSYFVTVRKQI